MILVKRSKWRSVTIDFVRVMYYSAYIMYIQRTDVHSLHQNCTKFIICRKRILIIVLTSDLRSVAFYVSILCKTNIRVRIFIYHVLMAIG